MAETPKNVPELAERYQDVFREAARVGDGVALGFAKLALGRWHVGPGGIALASEANDRAGVARQALGYLNGAIRHFQSQGMDPWLHFGLIQAAKAYFDLGQLDDVGKCFDNANTILPRFPILTSHQYEVIAQLKTARGDPDAEQLYVDAVRIAQESGLTRRHEFLEEILSRYRGRTAPNGDQ